MLLTFEIKKSVDFVFDHLVDMQKFRSVHPVIFKIDDKGNEEYLIHEKLKFIPFPFRYPVTVEVDSAQHEVMYYATIMGLVKVEMHFVLKEEGEYTRVDEKIEFKSFLPVGFIMNRVFRKQHALLFRNMGVAEAG